MLTESLEFERRARQVFDDSPYTVTTTDDGFRVDIDVADARWHEFFAKAGLEVAWRHQVKVKPGRYSITDRSTEVRWRAGVPTISWSKAWSAGTMKQFKAERTWAFDEQGNYRRVLDYQFNFAETRQVLRDIGDHLGLRYTMNGYAKAGLVSALVGAGGALLTLVVLGVLALTGNLG